MKLRIKHKLLLLLLCANTAIAAFMFVLNSQSFSAGFNQYIKDTEKTKLQPLIKEIGKVYQQQGNWLWLKQKRGLWHQLIQKHLNTQNLSLQPGNHRAEHFIPGQYRPHLPNIPGPTPPPQRGQNDLVFLDPHFYIQDQNRELVLGSTHNTKLFRWLPIKVNDSIIGYFGYFNNDKAKNQLDALFIKQQQRNFLTITLVLIGLSTVIAIPAATRFVHPINQLNQMLNRIAQGDYRQQINIKTNDEVADLSRNLNQLAETLEKNLHARQKWFASISHELRTPVAILKGEIEAVQDGIRLMDAHTFDSMHVEIERLNRLINDLHNLTLTDKAALSYQKAPTDINQLIAKLTERYHQALNDSGIQFKYKLPKTPSLLSADEKRFTQLLDNLMQNSLRYTDEPGMIIASLTHKPTKLTLTWEDSVPGVSDQELTQLLKPLYRTEQSRNRNFGGSGLGLAICKNIAEAHQGQMHLSHSELGGLTIKIDFSFS